MSKVSASEKNKIRGKEIDKIVDNMFKRAHRIHRIRRKRKLVKWLSSHLN
jgi:hypothetical protein